MMIIAIDYDGDSTNIIISVSTIAITAQSKYHK